MTDKVALLVEEAIALRYGADYGEARAPSDLLESLRDCRKRFDRIEYILVMLTQARQLAQQDLTAHSAEADSAWDAQAVAASKRSVERSYAGPRERYAEFNTATAQLQINRRVADTRYRQVDTAVDVVRTALRGLDGVRSDLHAQLRAYSVETRLEH